VVRERAYFDEVGIEEVLPEDENLVDVNDERGILLHWLTMLTAERS
jgi:hypothetical protein